MRNNNCSTFYSASSYANSDIDESIVFAFSAERENQNLIEYHMIANKKHVHVSIAGTLEKLISEAEKMSITELKITGFLNSKDFDVLDDMCTSCVDIDEDDNHTVRLDEPPFLTKLDLGECGMTGDPYLGEFTYYSKLEKLICPFNLEAISDLSVFENSTYLKTVVVPETFKEFGNGTFMNCSSLEEINFPESLERIGGFSFCDCTALARVKIPANVSMIEGAAFGGCYSLEKFEIQESNPYFTVTDGVLFSKDKTKLIAFPCGYKSKHYSVPEGTEIIGDGSFLGAEIESISFPLSLKIIEGWAFRLCEKLEILDIPDSVLEIGKVAFGSCSALCRVKLPDKLTILKQQTFSTGEDLKEIDIPASVKIIEDLALGWSNSLETIHLHDGLEVLNDLTNCKTLKNVVIPKTVKEIASGIFRKSVAMTEIKIDAENPYFCTEDGSLYSKDKTILIAIPYNENKTFVIPDGVQIIKDFVFEGFEKLEHIVLPSSLQIIGHRAFENCKALKSIHLPQSLVSIDFRAFDNCDNLQLMEIKTKIPPKITNPSSSNWKFLGYAKNIILHVPNESLNKYKEAFGWKDIKRIEAIG